jgi:predicted RecB family nuclease
MSKEPWLTKSRFLAGEQCPKRLWQQCHAPLEDGSESSPITETGLEVGRLAHRLFPNGAVAWTEGQTASQAIAATRAFVKDEAITAIFEAALQSGRLFARVDILERGKRGTWNICEVKLSTEVKDEHIDDVAFQLHVANEAGLKISRVEIIHVNRDYVLKDKGLEPKRYFRRVDVTAEAKKRLREIPGMIKTFLGIVDKDRAPDIEPWTQCHNPYTCEFLDRCTANKPKDWIFYLPRLGLQRGELLRAKGIESIAKIPEDIGLTEKQAIIRDVYRTGRPYISSGLKHALRTFGPPAYYLDFETMSPAIPLYQGTRPYERLPFQWSLHMRDKKGELQHSGFLADGGDNPREAFAESLIEKLASSTEPIIVYSSFERSTLNQLAGVLKQHRAAIENITSRLCDLLAIMREHVYYAEFGGSYSIKAVGPVIAPNITYDDLDYVADGGEASWAFERIVSGSYKSEENNLRQALEEYCRRDTLAMVEIHSRLAKTNQ